MARWDSISDKEFQELTKDLLDKEGFKNIALSQVIDLTATYEIEEPGGYLREEQWGFEIKTAREGRPSIEAIRQVAQMPHPELDVVTLVSSGSVSISGSKFLSQIPEVRVWDRATLEEMLADHPDLLKRHEVESPITPPRFSAQATELLGRLSSCQPGKEDWRDYEDICTNIWTFLFCPPLRKPWPQERTESRLDIRDAIFPNDAETGFWGKVRNDYSAKYVLLEFKNYTRSISKGEVGQAADYLKDELGNFGIIISRKPPSESAIKKRRETWEQREKLILLISDQDIGEMVMFKERAEPPEAVLRDLIDQFRIKY